MTDLETANLKLKCYKLALKYPDTLNPHKAILESAKEIYSWVSGNDISLQKQKPLKRK